VIAPEDVTALTTASTMSLFYREQPFKHTVMRGALCDTLQQAPLNTVELRYADMPLSLSAAQCGTNDPATLGGSEK
jgi:hypothetical protein